MDKSDLIVQPIISNDFLLKNSSSVVTVVTAKSKVLVLALNRGKNNCESATKLTIMPAKLLLFINALISLYCPCVIF